MILQGFDEFKVLIHSHAKAQLDRLKVIIYNTSDHAQNLEYGSLPGAQPWPNPGEKTEYVADIYDRGTRIASIQGFAMVRGSEEATKNVLIEELSKIDLGKPIEPQIEAIFERVGAFWKNEAKIRTPVDTGEAAGSWQEEIIK